MVYYISIHAAREGGDFNTRHCNFRNAVISIHAAREGGDAARSLPPKIGGEHFNPRRP